ncbi:hypothetical protein ACJZ2D_015924 [Fusarium nematophilum]
MLSILSYSVSHFRETRFQAPKSGESGGATAYHASIMLHRNLMLMHYHASRAIFCHYEILRLDVLRGGSGSITKDLSTIFDNRTELYDSAPGITACIQELAVLPLILNILDIKLSPPTKDANHSSATTTAGSQHQLNILIEAMKAWQPQYDGVDWISEIVRHIVELAQLDNQDPQTRSSMIHWTDILAFQAGSYLRLALTLDFSLSKGRLPQDGDFPRSLRGLFMVGRSPINEIVSASLASSHSPPAMDLPEALQMVHASADG